MGRSNPSSPLRSSPVAVGMAIQRSCRGCSGSLELEREDTITFAGLQLVLAAAAALSLCGAVAHADPGDSASLDGNGTLTWCAGEYDLRRAGGPEYPDFIGSIGEAINAAVGASDRSASYAVDGTAEDPQFALAQCRPDVPPDECSRCLSARRASVIYGTICAAGGARDGVCLLRYDVRDFSRFDENEPVRSAVQQDGGRSRPGLTKDVLDGQLKALAAQAAAAATPGKNGSRTAAGITDYPDGTAAGGRATVYGLAQCITQIPAQDCNRCLGDALFRLSEEFNYSAGMQVLRPSCMLRYSSSAFFNASSQQLPVSRFSAAEATSSPSNTSSPSHGRPITTTIGVGVGAGGALTFLIVLTLCLIQKSRRSKSVGSGSYSYGTLAAATGNFSEENKLGSGGCGVVYKGTLQDKREIAVKKLKGKGLKEMEMEVSLVAQLQHENLVKFLGHCFKEGEIFLVYEYLGNKSLSNYFKDSVDHKKLDWPKWFNIIKGIARGLTYLHRDSGKDIIHRDLKPCNVLLDSNFAAKIADFDLARGYNREKSHVSTNKIAGTYGYMAPECFSRGRFSTKSDVYSYGILVLEIIAGQSIRAFDAQNSTGLVEYVWQHWNGGRIEDVLASDHLGLVNHDQTQQALRCVHVALLCVQNDQNKRPAMEEVVHFLNTEMHLTDPSIPGFTIAAANEGHEQLASSVNGLTISVQEPR